MAEYTIDQVKAAAAKVAEAFADGFQLSDIPTVVGEVMKIVEQVKGMTGPEKKATATKIIEHVIDMTDTPFVPDALVDPIIKRFVPSLIEALIAASKGQIVNG